MFDSRAINYGLMALALWTMWGVFVRMGGKMIGPYPTLALMLAVEFTVMLVVGFSSGEFGKVLTPPNWKLASLVVMLAGLCGLAALTVFIKGIVGTGSPEIVIAIGATYPILVALFFRLTGETDLTWRGWLAVACCGTGIVFAYLEELKV